MKILFPKFGKSKKIPFIFVASTTEREMNTEILNEIEKADIYAAVLGIIAAHRTTKARSRATIDLEIFTSYITENERWADQKATTGQLQTDGRDVWMCLQNWKPRYWKCDAVLIGRIKAGQFQPYSFGKKAA